ncbi:hypothetical protein KP509_1Z220800 [Ceratopteris richardii]|nr:hypothetical protein KP509_1Z220800 [Ceratopteris richardii]
MHCPGVKHWQVVKRILCYLSGTRLLGLFYPKKGSLSPDLHAFFDSDSTGCSCEDPPKPEKIPEEDILGVTVLLLTCSYMGPEFIRVGYYVSNEYIDEQLREEPPPKVLIDKVQRNILSDKPRVTKFQIVFNSSNSDVPGYDMLPPEDGPVDTLPIDNGPQAMDCEISNF